MSTAHSAQGRTADAAVAIVSANSRADTFYVAASRGRHNYIVGVGTPDDVADAAKAALTRLSRQPTALDHGIRTETDAQAWADVLPPGLAAADIKKRAIGYGLTVDQADHTAGRYTHRQLACARDWIRAQEPHQNPQQLAATAARNWCLDPEHARPLADAYTAREQKRVEAEREQINRARQTLAAAGAGPQLREAVQPAAGGPRPSGEHPPPPTGEPRQRRTTARTGQPPSRRPPTHRREGTHRRRAAPDRS